MGQFVYLLNSTMELTKSQTCLLDVWNIWAPYLWTLIPSILSQYTFPPNCGRLSITRHFFPACFAR